MSVSPFISALENNGKKRVGARLFLRRSAFEVRELKRGILNALAMSIVASKLSVDIAARPYSGDKCRQKYRAAAPNGSVASHLFTPY